MRLRPLLSEDKEIRARESACFDAAQHAPSKVEGRQFAAGLGPQRQ